MAVGFTRITHPPLERDGPGIWQAVATAFRRWAVRRRRIATPSMSAEWLRQHEIESSKHRDAF